MKQQRAVDAVDRDADVRGTETTNSEFRLEVVAGGDAGQHLHRAERIVGNEAAKGEQLAAVQHRLARHTGLRLAKRARADRDVFDVGAGAAGDWNRDVNGIRPTHRHITAHESVADDGDEQRLRSDGNVVDLELAVRVGERLLPCGLDLDEDSGERRAGARFDDGAGDLACLREETEGSGEEEDQHSR